jgi:putative FmdB family regulatory protein
MPMYEYACERGHHFERFLKVADYQTPQTCDCGTAGRRVLSLPIVFAQRECVYDSPVDGRPITSWKQRREDLARNGCQEYDPEMKKDYHRRLEREDRELESKIEATVEAEIERMPGHKREALQNELNGGAQATPERSTVPISTVRELSK